MHPASRRLEPKLCTQQCASRDVAVLQWLDVALMMDEGLEHLTCIEAEALADVYRAYGRADAAECIIRSHAWGDDDGSDRHHDLYRSLISRIGREPSS